MQNATSWWSLLHPEPGKVTQEEAEDYTMERVKQLIGRDNKTQFSREFLLGPRDKNVRVYNT